MRPPADPGAPDPAGVPGVRPYLTGRPPGGRRAIAGPPADAPEPPALRPFVITAGRVNAADPDIGMETQVTRHPGALPAPLPPESRAIVALCERPLSVAEISAKLRMHLGVTRILVGDLRAAGQLDVHVISSDFPDPETIMRVIRGLRAIS
ncbi:DUF742 domain-containing protein [Spirilliplanes yamanashiensis]|uniref:DUF742 domain-containing protein n=1 Tax=Spirilliplanes yamanashiensis TaxID=42233 RepID=A0A8J4DIV8_9ACTN|nr:DUF742 domain-containing protein [Spirilliplanes yamanashiensis]MDP9814702.1 hypothetical protein [Spirilliplanes yamanashiensis]GIJ02355.1 hypothetical protein Sya03_17070 [Spirilliplanes yamanashiensis]